MLWSKGREPWFDSSKKVLFIYLLLSLTWIVSSDRVVAKYITDRELNLAAQTYKGWFYVLVVGVFIYLEKEMANRRIRERENRFEDAIQNTNAAYFRMDKQAKIVEVNDAWLKMYRYDNPSEVIGKSFKEFQVPEFMDKAEEIVKELLGGKKLTGEFTRLNKDGSVGYFTYSASPVYRNGVLIGFEAFMVDVTDQKAIDKMLKERDQKFRALFENMTEGVAIHEIVFDKSGSPINYKVVEINKAFESNTGIKMEIAKDKLATELYQSKEPPYFKQYFGVVRTGKPYTFESYFEPLKRYFYISAFPLDKKHFVTVFQDITDRKKYEQEIVTLNTNTLLEKRKFELVVREMGDAVVVIDNKNAITMVNTAMEKLCGFSEKELVGTKYNEILKFIYEKDGKELIDIEGPIFRDAVTKRPKDDVCLIRKDGKQIAVDGVASPIKDEADEVIGAVGIMRDVSKQRELDKMRTDFVSMASHQLRTPLTGIKWFTELLADQSDKLPPTELKKYVYSIKESNERMISLVSDMLNVSRIESGKFPGEHKGTHSLKEIFNLVLEDQNKLIVDMGIKVDGVNGIDSSIRLKGDLTTYLQIFGNLINNAVKYSPKGAVVEVKTKKDKSMITTIISDKGLGIPDEQKSRLFEKFFRADNVSKITAGSGLGLYVVKNLVENYGGKIRIESKKGEGTQVYVQLPFIINTNGK